MRLLTTIITLIFVCVMLVVASGIAIQRHQILRNQRSDSTMMVEKSPPTSPPSPLPSITATPITADQQTANDCITTPRTLSNGQAELISVVAKHLNSKSLESISVHQQADQYAQGECDHQWWLAHKRASSTWEVVASGSTYVDCAQIAVYDFPVEIVPACWDEINNQLIQR